LKVFSEKWYIELDFKESFEIEELNDVNRIK